jgi:hypothetical protein
MDVLRRCPWHQGHLFSKGKTMRVVGKETNVAADFQIPVDAGEALLRGNELHKDCFLVTLPHSGGIYTVLCDGDAHSEQNAIEYVLNDFVNADEEDSYPDEINENAVTCQRLTRTEADACHWDLYMG